MGKQVPEHGDVTQRMKGDRETYKSNNITLHLGFPPHPCPQRCLYTILKKLRRLNFIWYWLREVGKRSQPKSLLENVELFHFSHLFRASVGCTLARHGCTHVAPR
jgi:hypothetical protein